MTVSRQSALNYHFRHKNSDESSAAYLISVFGLKELKRRQYVPETILDQTVKAIKEYEGVVL
jgi:hypothetical protein